MSGRSNPQELADGKLLLDEPAAGVTRLTISNPAKRNALDHPILDAVTATLTRLAEDQATRCVILTGAHGMFSAGYDIGEIPDEEFEERAEALVAHPFTEAMTTQQLMMTTALKELYAYLDTLEINDDGASFDRFRQQYKGVPIVVEASQGPIPVAQSVDPTSPNFLHWYDPDVATAGSQVPGCQQDPMTLPTQAPRANTGTSQR